MSILDEHKLTLDEIAALSADELFDLQEETEEQKNLLRNRVAYLEYVMDLRYSGRAEQARKEQGKDTGTIRLTDNDYVVVVEAPKQVHWDRDKLANVFDSMDPDHAKHYAKWTLAVEERKYTAAPPHIKAALEPARTVSTGKQKYRIEPKMEPLQEKTDGV